MDITQFEQLVVSALEDVKAKDIQVINTTRLTSLFDRAIVASGDSNRQTRALARHVADKAREAGLDVVGIEGEGTGEWVLVGRHRHPRSLSRRLPVRPRTGLTTP